MIMAEVRSTMDTHNHERPAWLTAGWIEPRLVVVTLMALIAGSLLERAGASQVLVTAVAVIAYLTGGWFGTVGAIRGLRDRRIDVDMLMILAALGAAVVGAWVEGATLLFLFSLSNVLQDYAIGRSRKAITGLFKLYPEQATVVRNGTKSVVGLDALRVGDLVLIQPGERIPVDGVVTDGRSSVDQSPITGESIPIDKLPGDTVFAGTLNKQGVLDVQVTALASESTLSRIVHMVEQANENKAQTERFLDKFEERYAVAILGFIALLIVVPPLLFGADFGDNFYRAMVVMTVASPCALAISVPASFIAAIASAARSGVLFKGGAYLEQLADIKAVAFDKTGTLTAGEPAVTDIVPLNGMDRADILAIAGAVEARSEHPLAKAITDAADPEAVARIAVTDFEAVPGQGLHAVADGQEVWIGSPQAMAAQLHVPADVHAETLRLEQDGKTVVGITWGGKWRGLIALADQLRPEAKRAVDAMRSRGLTTVMLTGDNPRVADLIAKQVGIDAVHAGLLPQDKAAVIESLRVQYGPVAMVGDGINDAPALAVADLGVAMGAAGTDVALETADLVLMGDKVERLATAIDLSRLARRVVWQNIIFSLSVMIGLIIAAFTIGLALPLGVLGHEGSTVIVVTNGLVQLLLLPTLKSARANRGAGGHYDSPAING